MKHLNESVQMLYLNTQDSVSGDRKRSEGVWGNFSRHSHAVVYFFKKNLSMEKGLDDSMNQREEKQRWKPTY